MIEYPWKLKLLIKRKVKANFKILLLFASNANLLFNYIFIYVFFRDICFPNIQKLPKNEGYLITGITMKVMKFNKNIIL